MNPGESEITAQELRSRFDESFGRAADIEPGLTENLLVVRAGTGSFALRLAGVKSLLACPRLTRVPSRAPHLVGVGAIRGTLVGVYSLASLLDTGPLATGAWMCLCTDPSVGLAFDELQGYARVAVSDMKRERAEASVAGQIVQIGNTRRIVVEVLEIVAAITNGSGAPVNKE